MLRDNQVISCNLESPNVDFRMNEHTFSELLSSDKQFVHKMTTNAEQNSA